MYVGRRGAQYVTLQHRGATKPQVLTTCLVTGQRMSMERGTRPGTCYTHTVAQLQTGDRLWVQMGYPRTAVRLGPQYTYWGLKMIQPE